jgi:hypothetical protein
LSNNRIFATGKRSQIDGIDEIAFLCHYMNHPLHIILLKFHVCLRDAFLGVVSELLVRNYCNLFYVNLSRLETLTDFLKSESNFIEAATTLEVNALEIVDSIIQKDSCLETKLIH